MDYISTKAIYIAVGIFVTISIVSGIMFIMTQIAGIYSDVNETDISIKNKFNKYTMYDNVELIGLDMFNTAKKFRSADNVKIMYNGTKINDVNDTFINNNPNFDYNKKFDVSYVIDETDVTIITFKEK